MKVIVAWIAIQAAFVATPANGDHFYSGHLPRIEALAKEERESHCILNDERYNWSRRVLVSFKNTFSTLSDDYIKRNSADAGGRDNE